MLVVTVKPEPTELAELMTEEREEREELISLDSELEIEDNGSDDNPLNVEVAGKEVVKVGIVGMEVGLFTQTSELP